MLDDIIIPKFKDMHQHLREGLELPYTIQWANHWCEDIVAMPNLGEPLTTPGRWSSYKDLVQLYNTGKLNVIIPLYLTDKTTCQDIQEAYQAGVRAAKAYPKGKTSHSAWGISSFSAMVPVFTEMAHCGMKLLIHPEHPDTNAWDGERDFFEDIWPVILKLVHQHGLCVSLEHLSTALALATVAGDRTGLVVGTVTPHHALAHAGHIGDQWDSGYMCKPMLKTPFDTSFIREMISFGEGTNILLGSDSAPWPLCHKHKYRPCSGCWTAPWLPQLLATVFTDSDGDLDAAALQKFTHDNAVKWWGLKPSQEKIRIYRGETRIPEIDYGFVHGYLPFWSGKILPWQAQPVFI